MKILLIPITLLFYSVQCLCQNDQIVYTKLELLQIGTISMPSNLEVQAGNYKIAADSIKDEIYNKQGYEYSGDRIVFQQKGANDFEESGFTSYVRVILETTYGKVDDYEKITTKIAATQTELNELSLEFKSQVNESLKLGGLKLIEWYGMSVVSINGRSALKASYLRQLKSNPLVMVDLYYFQNNDRMHLLTTAYRQTDKNIWVPVINKMVNSFTITNIR